MRFLCLLFNNFTNGLFKIVIFLQMGCSWKDVQEKQKLLKNEPKNIGYFHCWISQSFRLLICQNTL